MTWPLAWCVSVGRPVPSDAAEATRGSNSQNGIGQAEECLAWRAHTLADVQDALGIATAHVVGVAFGAVVAANLASAHADRVKTLTLISLPPNQDNEDTVMGYIECRDVSW